MSKRVLPEPEKYASCPYDGRILEYYEGQFDSVFILLHPFIQPVRINLNRFRPSTWPNKKEIIEGCVSVSWKKVLELTGLNTLSDIDIGLRTSISGIKKEFCNEVFAGKLDDLIEERAIVHPTEGELSPLLENRLFQGVKAIGYDWLWVGDEFGTERKLYWIDDLIEKDEVPSHGCVFTHDQNLLITTHWDSHCSFLCSTRDRIERILALDHFEGFFCSEKTEVYWGLHEI